MQWKYLVGAASLAAIATSFAAIPSGTATTQDQASADRCTAIGEQMKTAWPEKGTRIVKASFLAEGAAPAMPGPPGMSGPAPILPAHCDLIGTMRERTGVDGQSYAIRFHLRLPTDWNGRLLMEGGGGTNGNLGAAIGPVTGGKPALAHGFAVLSQDSGHDNAVNSNPARGGDTAFGFDPQARAEYGGTSLPAVTLAAKALVNQFYQRAPQYSYFVGCSKGGQEGMMLAQRYPELYDGIVAAAPGFALPRAALAEAWDTQQFASVAKAHGQPVNLQSISGSFSTGDLTLVRAAILNACDADDGAKDDLVQSFRQCTSAKVVPELKRAQCTGDKAEGCLSTAQIAALTRVHEGPRGADGKPLYAAFPWDAGWSDMGWRIWKIGMPGGMPSINVMMGIPALASIFTSPPTVVPANPDALLAYAMTFDFSRDAGAIYATAPGFARSAWQDIGARSPDLAAFHKRGGKLIVPHGSSDPVFSLSDTVQWWDEVNAAQAGRAADFARVFAVPGMGHCQGGPATDRFDAFAAVMDWVEKGNAPDQILASASPMSPWPGRTRPLCAHPYVAVARAGATDMEKAENFSCERR